MTSPGRTALIFIVRVLTAAPGRFPPVSLPARRARTARLSLAVTAAAAGAVVLAMARRRASRRRTTRPGTPAARELPQPGRLRQVATRVDLWILIATIAGVVIAYLALARSR
jgi:hypothetical protein